MKAWKDFLIEQENEIGSATVKQWLSSLEVSSFDACNLYLEAKDSFQIHWFEEHVRPKLAKCFLNQNRKPIKVHLSLASKGLEEKIQKQDSKQKSFLPKESSFCLEWDELDTSQTLENFIPSKDNQVPYRLFSMLAEGSQEQGFNPIFISGQPGTGKTHLLMGLALALKNMGKKVIYTKAETFTEHVVNSIRLSEMHAFRNAYRNSDALFIDDIEIFSRKNATQEELFHTFNTLHLAGKQIVLSSKHLPKNLEQIEPRLISRFEWGIVLSLTPLEKEDMKKLLLQRLEKIDLKLSENCLSFLIETFKNTHSLVQAIEALSLRLHLQYGQEERHRLTTSTLQTLLSDLIKVENEKRLTPEKIIKSVAEVYGIRMEDILGKAQSKECSFPRQVAMYLCRNELKLPYMKIGHFFSRDHSTVMTSVKLVEETKLKDANVSYALSSILKRIQT